MTIHKIIYLVLSLLLFIPSSASARATVPIENYENVAIASSTGTTVTAEQVKRAFQNAGLRLGWTFTEPSAGQMLGTLLVRNKHTIMINIIYTGEHYSVSYSNSVNMKYSTKNDKPVIHPSYNKWVKGLLDGMRIELNRN